MENQNGKATPLTQAKRRLALVYDIPADHTRVRYLDDTGRRALNLSGGYLDIVANPGGVVYPGMASLKAVLKGNAELTCVNAANLEELDPRFAFINLPFALNDSHMSSAGARQLAVDILDSIAVEHDLRLLALMRGTDAIFVFPHSAPQTIDAMADKRIRTAGGGTNHDIAAQLGAIPVVLPIPLLKPAFDRGEIDGVMTSPGAWASQLGMTAPHMLHVPGLMMITYALLARRGVVESLNADVRSALFEAARIAVTDEWSSMADDDTQIIEAMRAQGATVSTGADTTPWRNALKPISIAYAARYPDIWARLLPIMEMRI